MSEARERITPAGGSVAVVQEEFEQRYRAVRSRDTRFDGRFFTAVTSTGVYCRPSCPAQTPKRENVRFYPVAAAAEAAGFRACRRCRPDASPGSPDWNVRADLTSRALLLVAEGVVDTDGVSGLARRLSVSERHLHRQLVAEVGAGPLALARTRRAQTARLLIESTELQLIDVAFSAGFASLRQFNDTMLASFGCAPSALRRSRTVAPAADGTMTLRLQHRLPLAAGPLLGFLAARAVPGVEEVDGDRYRHTLRLPRAAGAVELRLRETYVEARLRLTDLRDLTPAVERCRRLLDLDADTAAVDDVLGQDPVLAPLVAAHPGLRVPGHVDGFELAVRAVLGQQVSVPGARTLAGRLVRAFGDPLPTSWGMLTTLFPTADSLAAADLSSLGLTSRRAATLRSLAEAVATGRLVLDGSADRAETRRLLLSLPGIGPWTTEYVSMRALGDPDSFPATDLGIRQALARHGATVETAQRWRPWRSYAAQHLWTNLTEGNRS